jgi:hypothetical protein
LAGKIVVIYGGRFLGAKVSNISQPQLPKNCREKMAIEFQLFGGQKSQFLLPVLLHSSNKG